MTGCTCTQPGYCDRHRVTKHKHWFHLCQTNQAYFDLWEQGKGPGQTIVVTQAPPHTIEYHLWPCISVRHLLYHVCPLRGNEIWRLNVQQVRRRLSIFSGKRCVAVAQGEGLHSLAEVQREFATNNIVWLPVKNDPELREVASFSLLLEQTRSIADNEAVFYAHTKGNSTAGNVLGSEFWRNAMYHHLLDHLYVVMDLLMSHPCVGTHKMHYPDGNPPYPSKLLHGNWMYAGTYFWFRSRDVYGHPDWRNVPQDRYGAEAWLSGLFSVEQAPVVFQPYPAHIYPTANPYAPEIYRWPMRD